jgi:ribosomal protein S18 acetylase RimI-like enzyme
MRRVQEVKYTSDGENIQYPAQILVQRVGFSPEAPSPNNVAEDMLSVGYKAFAGSNWLRQVAERTGQDPAQLADNAFPALDAPRRRKRVMAARKDGPTAFWTAVIFDGPRQEVSPYEYRTGFLATETHVRGPRFLRPFLSSIGRLVTVNVTELFVDPDFQDRGVATALADAALREVPRGATVRFTAPANSLVSSWAANHDLPDVAYRAVEPDESTIGARMMVSDYALPVEQVQAELRATNSWLTAGTVKRD